MFDFLKPISRNLIPFIAKLPNYSLAKIMQLHTEEYFPDLQEKGVVLFSVNENRKSQDWIDKELSFDEVRKKLYSLVKGDWDIKLYDIGQIFPGASVEDTYFAVKSVVEFIHSKKCISVILGGSQDLTYPNYRAYDVDKGMVNIVNIDATFDLGNVDLPISNKTYIGKIVVDQPYNLFNYTNIGYQSYYVTPEELDLIEQMFFDAFRLGEISKDISLAEPVFRNADMVSLDLNAVEAAYFGDNPNGFTGKEICTLSRYAGISDKLTSFGVFEYRSEKANQVNSMLVAQVIWYFIEGVSCRWGEIGELNNMDVTHYQVPLEDHILSFYRSNKTQRWWMEISYSAITDNILTSNTLLPCTYKDYEDACNQIIPERWLNAKMKFEM